MWTVSRSYGNSPAITGNADNPSVGASCFQRVDEGAIPPALAHGLHGLFFPGALSFGLLDQSGSDFGANASRPSWSPTTMSPG